YVHEGNLALKSGNKELARSHFRKAINQNRNDIQAWLGLAASVDNEFERVHCLQTVLNIDPRNKLARKALNHVVGDIKQENEEKNDTLDESFDSLRASYAAKDDSSIEAVQNPESSLSGYPFTRPKIVWEDDEEDIKPARETPKPTEELKIENAVEKPKVNNNVRKIIIWTGVGVLGVCILMSLLTGVLYQVVQIVITPTPAFMAVARPIDVKELTETAKALSPTSSPELSPTPSITPTLTVTPTISYPVANPTVQVRFAEIQKEVADLRGLAILNPDIPAFAINRKQAEDYFFDYTRSEEFATYLENHKQALVLLGFVKPTYDMLSDLINHQVDNLGGFYTPGDDRIFVVTNSSVGGLEYLVFAHEYDHALVEQHFKIKDMGVYPECRHNLQQCQAFEALYEGDATLLMEIWANQFFTQRDYLDIINNLQPFYKPSDESIPPYLAQDASFSYLFGRQFVNNYYGAGSWAAVDKLYLKPPISTEQIIHPEKYNDNEQPVDVKDSDLTETLGENWELVESDVLGEWMTYLLLAYNADLQSQIDPQIARYAAAGWGGDRYQVYRNKSDGSKVLAAHWVWDRDYDASEFFSAMRNSLENRFRGNHIEGLPGGQKCWNVADNYSCLYLNKAEVLWLLTPQESQLNTMLLAFPTFQNKFK
ncbi:MAG: hypothetical protein LWX83_19345, partial [Anaerolineae bacterium]|nr:hypothetical protein [Anaerolineae bacterium]